MTPLKRVLERLIERLGNTDELEEKLDVFYAVGSITKEDYIELTGKEFINTSEGSVTEEELNSAYVEGVNSI